METYGVMPELYLEIERLFKAGEIAKAREIQYEACRIIYAMCGCKGNLYAVMKAILKMREGIDCGSVRNPSPQIIVAHTPKVEACAKMIDEAMKKFF